jgi:hypothetical protein
MSRYGRAEYKWRTDARLTAAQVRAAHRLHVEAGLSIRELGRQMWERFGYANEKSCANSLSDLFKRAGLPARDRIEATVAASTTHGRGARADKAAYKRWHRHTFGPWPSDLKEYVNAGASSLEDIVPQE